MDAELLAKWEITQEWLRTAENRIVVDPNVAEEYLAKFEDYLSHNELELALCELAEAAKISPQSYRFWDAMCQAAAHMSLDELYNLFAAEWAAIRRP